MHTIRTIIFAHLLLTGTSLHCLQNSYPFPIHTQQNELLKKVHETLAPICGPNILAGSKSTPDKSSFNETIVKTSNCKHLEMLYQVHEVLYFFSYLRNTNLILSVENESAPLNKKEITQISTSQEETRVGFSPPELEQEIAQLSPPLEIPEVEFSRSEVENNEPSPPQESSNADSSPAERVKKSPSPSDGIFLETGLISLDMFYKYKREKEYDKAKEVMLKYLERNPDNFTANIEMAYLLLHIEEYRESIPYLKKAYTLHNEDPQIALQIAYTFDHIEKTDSAIEYYTIAADGDDPIISKKAQAELDAKQGAGAASPDTNTDTDREKEKKSEGVFDRKFLEFYADSVYYNRFTNWVFSIDLKLGVTLDKCDRHQVYMWLWEVKDTKSSGGTTPAIFSDNVAIVSLGYRYRLLKDKYAFLYANFGEAYDLVYRNRSISRGDFRAGLYFYDSWSNKNRLPGLSRSCYIQRVGDIDFNFTYYSRYRYWIGYAAWKEGINIFETKYSNINVYLRQFLAFDTVGEFFNNVYELGPVVEIYPYKPFPIKFLGGWVQGYYYRNRSSSPNPYGPRYTDLRFQAIVWTFF